MKKQFAIAALTFGAIVLGTNNVQAQEKKIEITSEAVQTVVSIDLKDAISLKATNNAPVNFTYHNAEAYNDAQTKEKATSLEVTSTRLFNVNARVGGANFVDDKNANNVIPVNVLTITAKPGANGGMDGGMDPVNLIAEKDLPLVVRATRGSKLTLDLDYTIPADKSSSPDILGKPAATYKQTVTYTATTE